MEGAKGSLRNADSLYVEIVMGGNLFSFLFGKVSTRGNARRGGYGRAGRG